MSKPKLDAEEEEEDHFSVLQTHAPVDPSTLKLSCANCHGILKWLPGFPEGHQQWLCTSCGTVLNEGYGDTPVHESAYRFLDSPNDPYATDLSTFAGPMIKDIPNDLDDEEKQQYWADIRDKMKKRRYGMRYAFMTPEEASRQI